MAQQPTSLRGAPGGTGPEAARGQRPGKRAVVRDGLIGAAGLLAAAAAAVAVEGAALTLLWTAVAAGLIGWGARGRLRTPAWCGLLLLAAAAGRSLLLSTFPGMVGTAPVGPAMRAALFILVAAALFGARWRFGRARANMRLLTWLGAAANLALLWWLTLEVTLVYDGRHDARVAGHEGLMVATVWGLYGLGLALVERRASHPHLRNGARAVLMAALAYLMLGALQGNAQWALWPYRYGAYAAVLGGIWIAEGLFRQYPEDRDVQGLLGLTAALMGFGIGGFEVNRWLEPLFTLPDGQQITAELLAWQRSTRAFWYAAIWGLYALVVMAVGVRLRSSRTRLLAVGLFAAAMLLTALLAVRNLAADPGLRILAFAALVPGACAAVVLSVRAPGERHPYETLFGRLLLLGAGLLTAYWGLLEWLGARG